MTNNPFRTKFSSTCQAQCDTPVQEGDLMFAHAGGFVCEECAYSLDIICPECGSYKKPEFALCFNCKDDEEVIGDEIEMTDDEFFS